MFVRASHGYQRLNDKFQTRWLSDTTHGDPHRVTWLCCENDVQEFGFLSFNTFQ